MCTVPAAKEFLEAGIHVICDKPLTTGLKEAERARRSSREAAGVVFVADPQLHRLSDDPAGARRWWPKALLGTIRFVQAEYPQDWLTTKLEIPAKSRRAGAPIPKQSGPAGAIGDIGTHAL